MNLRKIMSVSPYLEVLIRNIYWRSPILLKYFNKKTNQKKQQNITKSIASNKFINYLSSIGIGKEDLIILHSSFKSIRAANETPYEIIDKLRQLIGKNGNLAMPAIPHYNNGPDISKRLTADVNDLLLTYDPNKTPAWTGILPNTLIKYPESIRSLHPLNSMVAIGPLAKQMMKYNISDKYSLPCGKRSSWYFCYKNNAKIIAVGTDLAHSLTMIHVAEDMWDDKWIVPNWYRKRKFKIIINGNAKMITVRERHPKWAMYYAERTLSKDLIKKGISTKTDIDGVNIEIVEAKKLVNYLNSRNHNAYPYYLV